MLISKAQQVELIVGILALIRGELRIVQTSLLGSILSNLLLVLGCSFLAGGLKFKEQKFQMTAAQASSSLMVLGCSTLIIPAAFHASQLDGSLNRDDGSGFTILDELAKKSKDLQQLLTLSRGTAIVSGLSELNLYHDILSFTVVSFHRSSSSAMLAVRPVLSLSHFCNFDV